MVGFLLNGNMKEKEEARRINVKRKTDQINPSEQRSRKKSEKERENKIR